MATERSCLRETASAVPSTCPAVALRSAYKAKADGIAVASACHMLKLLGSYAIARLLGFGLLGAVVIYLLLTLIT